VQLVDVVSVGRMNSSVFNVLYSIQQTIELLRKHTVSQTPDYQVPTRDGNIVKSWPLLKFFTAGKSMKLQIKPRNISRYALGMLLRYAGKL